MLCLLQYLVLLIPRPGALGAELHDGINYAWLALVWITKTPCSAGCFRRPRAIAELRRLVGIVGKKYFGFALPHTGDARTQIGKPSIELIVVGLTVLHARDKDTGRLAELLPEARASAVGAAARRQSNPPKG